MNEPARMIAIGVYDNKGTLRRTIPIRGDGVFEAFHVAANEMVYSILDLGDGSTPSLAPWQTSHRPALIENRWAAFTDDELEELEFAIINELDEERGPDYHLVTAIRVEITSELERRRTGTPPPA